MVDKIPARSAAPVALDEMLERLLRYDPEEQASFDGDFLEEAVDLLQRFAANENIARRFIDDQGGLASAAKHFVPPQTILLASNPRLAVRLNVWLRPKVSPFREREEALFAYNLAHNHDFDFVTVGYSGEGYTTDVCAMDADDTLLPAGSPIRLSDPRRETLSPGSVLTFRAFTDVHVQLPPDELSVSINLISRLKPKGYEHVFVDMERSELIEAVADGELGRLMTLVDVAAGFPTTRTAALLERIARETPRSALRDVALGHFERLRAEVARR